MGAGLLGRPMPGQGVGLGLEAPHLQWSPLSQGGRRPQVWAGGEAGAQLMALRQGFGEGPCVCGGGGPEGTLWPQGSPLRWGRVGRWRLGHPGSASLLKRGNGCCEGGNLSREGRDQAL